MMAYHWEAEVEKASEKMPKSDPILIGWLARFRTCLGLRNSMILWILIQISAPSHHENNH